MKATLEQAGDSLSTTPEAKIKFKEELFNHINKLGPDHDVTVSNTMIKITYKKTLKDQNSSDVAEDSGPGKNKSDSDVKPQPEESKSTIEAEKKRKYVNGLNLVPKSSLPEVTSDECGGSRAAEVKTKKFLKDSEKKLDKNVSRLEDSVNVLEVDKSNKSLEGGKRKSPVELGVAKSKKVKFNESKEQKQNPKRFKRQIMLVDPDLPAGWTRFISIKNKGTDKERYVVYVVDPQGKKFRYRWKLRQYLEKTKSSLNADQFFFGVYKKSKTSSSEKDENQWKKEKTPELKPAVVHDEKPKTSSSEKDENQWKKEKTPELKPAVVHDEKPYKPPNPEKKELLLYDPNLPFGWKRIISSNAENGKKQVHIISPDGKIFRRRYHLQEYLEKHQYTHKMDQFYFGLYPKKEENGGECQSSVIEPKSKDSQAKGSAIASKKATPNSNRSKGSATKLVPAPMFDDPNLPEGWFRLIRIRSCGESAGKMEVIIVSPDGRRHRSRKHLEHYLSQNGLKHKSEDFDFTLFGKSNLNSQVSERQKNSALESAGTGANVGSPLEREEDDTGLKRRLSEKPVPDLDIQAMKETVITPEGHLINAVNGLMMCSGLSSARNERRQRVPRKEFEKNLSNYLSSEVGRRTDDASSEGCDIPTRWIEKLVRCRSEFRSLEPSAMSTIADTTKEFVKKLAVHALTDPERGLRYEDMAELVDRTESLSFLKSLIPKKITFKEFIRLNRPKQFSSFT